MKTIYATGINEKGETLEFLVENGHLYCANAELVSLIIPEIVTHLDCYCNSLSSLDLPMNLIYLDCRDNILQSLIIPNKVEDIDCRGNLLTWLHFPDSVKYVNASRNPIYSVTLPKNIKYFSCDDSMYEKENWFVNPKTHRIVVKQNDLYYCGCFCHKTFEELKQRCNENGFIEVLEYFEARI